MMRRFFLAAILVMGWVTVAEAGPYEDAVSAYNRRDFELAERLFRPLAEQGHALAQFYLGVMYDKGQGVPQDAQEALKWIRLAAEQGEATQEWIPQDDQGALAQCNMGVMFAYEQGIPQDAQKVAKWFRQGAEKGDAGAQCNLGGMYYGGYGVPQDHQEALKWYRKAAKQGHSWAQVGLGEMYKHGLGTPQDFVRAYMWVSVAAAASSGEEEKVARKLRDLAASRMTAAQIEKAQEMARHCQDTKFKECD